MPFSEQFLFADVTAWDLC